MVHNPGDIVFCMKTIVAPSEKTYSLVKAGFIAQGTTLNKWCQSQGIFRQYARIACLGQRNGPKATALLERLLEASQSENLLTKITDRR